MYWGLLPVPSLIAVIAALRFAVARSVFYDPGWLIPVTNSLFVTLIFLTVAYIAARNLNSLPAPAPIAPRPIARPAPIFAPTAKITLM